MSGLLTAEIRRRLPPLYSTAETPNPMVRAKFFTPWAYWTWYAIEFDGKDLFFGLVEGHESELGYFSLSELESVRGPGGVKIERDAHFRPKTLRRLREDLLVWSLMAERGR